MFLKVAIVSIMAICAEGNPVYSQQSNHAISLQSFHRHDVPISYNYSAIHVYTTPNPEQHSSNPKNPMQFNRIQYAPIRVEGKEINSAHYTKVSNPTTDVVPEHEYSTKELIRKDYLEPRNLAPNYLESPNHKFIPGDNVDVLQSLRSPAHDAIYRSFPGFLDHNNVYKINNLHNNIVYRQPAAEQQPTTTIQTPISIKVTESKSPVIAFTSQLVAIPNKIKNEPKGPQHAMIHRLHLNVARVYNNPQMSVKGSDNINPFMKSLNRDPSQARAIIFNKPQTKHMDVPYQQKTYLFPV